MNGAVRAARESGAGTQTAFSRFIHSFVPFVQSSPTHSCGHLARWQPLAAATTRHGRGYTRSDGRIPWYWTRRGRWTQRRDVDLSLPPLHGRHVGPHAAGARALSPDAARDEPGGNDADVRYCLLSIYPLTSGVSHVTPRGVVTPGHTMFISPQWGGLLPCCMYQVGCQLCLAFCVIN